VGGMPYHLEKGPMFATIEAVYYNKALLRQFLYDLWHGKALGSHGVLSSPSADSPNPTDPNATGADRLQSMRHSWFGDVLGGGPQPPWGGPHPDRPGKTFTTGYWAFYYGNVRQIVTETLTRAAEVSLGVARPADPLTAPMPPDNTRHWPVELFWKCGQPRFEGWVTWRDDEEGRTGQVTVIFATPGTPDTVYTKPAKGADPVEGITASGFQGMWVCAHSDHRRYIMVGSIPTPIGDWHVPKSEVVFTRGEGPVGTWAPKYGLGGPPPGPVIFQQGP